MRIIQNQPSGPPLTIYPLDFAPSEWKHPRKVTGVHVTCFQVLVRSEYAPKGRPITVDIGHVRAILAFGSLVFQSKPELTATETENAIQLHLFRASAQQQTHDALFLFLCQPYEERSGTADSTDIEARAGYAAGVIAAGIGRNVLFHKIYEGIRNVGSAGGHRVSNTITVVKGELSPDSFTRARIDVVQVLHNQVHSQGEEPRAKAELSLRWFEQAITTPDEAEADAFLKFWIALEILAMDEGTNIRPIRDILSRSYGISFEDAKEQFEIGRLFGLRSRMVHHGETGFANSDLLRLMEATYADVLFGMLGLPSERRVERLKANPKFSFMAALGLT